MINNTQDDINIAIIYDAKSYSLREFTLSPLSESRSAPCGRQLVGQAAKLTLSLPVGCYKPGIHKSLFVLFVFVLPHHYRLRSVDG